MPDITMCKGENCPIKNKCWRFRAIPNRNWQSYFTGPHYDPAKEECVYFWDVGPDFHREEMEKTYFRD